MADARKTLSENMTSMLAEESALLQKIGRSVALFFEGMNHVPPAPIVVFAYGTDESPKRVLHGDMVLFVGDDGVLLIVMESFEVAFREFALDGNHTIVDDLRIAQKLRPLAAYVLTESTSAGRYIVGTVDGQPHPQA